MESNKNIILAIALSLAVLLGWQFFVMAPAQKQKMQEAAEAQKRIAVAKSAVQDAQPAGSPAAEGLTNTPASAPTVPVTFQSRDAAISASPRVAIDSPLLLGSINLKGGRIDDVTLRNYTEGLDKNSAKVTLLSPSGSPEPFFAYTGWLAASPGIATPGETTFWEQEGSNALSPSTPVTLRYDNGGGLVFRRTVSVDDRYMFQIADEVENKSSQPVTLRPFGQVARLSEPKTSGYTVLHEGLVGILGQSGLKELVYACHTSIPPFSWLQSDCASPDGAKQLTSATGGWLGFTDQYWAAVLIPDQTKPYDARLFGNEKKQFYTDYIETPLTVAPGERQTATSRLFAGAKEVGTLNKYQTEAGVERLSNLIDWGWFPFLTHPMFALMNFFYKLVGNFGVSILLTTILVKLLFFPLANRSYVAMSKMKALQPEIKKLQERYKDDKAKVQSGLMELYRKEKVNPVAGCLPVLIQAPVFFALYKVLLVTIEMRHAPFVGWIRDLSSPDPTSIFTLFGLIPWSPPQFLMLGALPILMGISMWVQMRLNPTPTDPVQQQVFTFMPILFTFMLAHFPAGLVLYWTWNNLLSFTQQAVIMKRQGTEVDMTQKFGIKNLPSRLQSLPNRFKPNGRNRSPAE